MNVSDPPQRTLTIEGTIVNNDPPITKYFLPIATTSTNIHDQAEQRAIEAAVSSIVDKEVAAIEESRQDNDDADSVIMDAVNNEHLRPITPGKDLFVEDVFDHRRQLWNPSKSPVSAARKGASQLKGAKSTSLLSISKQKINPPTTQYVTATTNKSRGKTYSTPATISSEEDSSDEETTVPSQSAVSKENSETAAVSSSEDESSDEAEELEPIHTEVQKELSATTNRINELQEEIRKLYKENDKLKEKHTSMSPSSKNKNVSDVSKKQKSPK
jgi:hypothetical protein